MLPTNGKAQWLYWIPVMARGQICCDSGLEKWACKPWHCLVWVNLQIQSDYSLIISHYQKAELDLTQVCRSAIQSCSFPCSHNYSTMNSMQRRSKKWKSTDSSGNHHSWSRQQSCIAQCQNGVNLWRFSKAEGLGKTSNDWIIHSWNGNSIT